MITVIGVRITRTGVIDLKRYRKKPVEVEVVQWTGSNKDKIIEFATRDVWFSEDDMYIVTLEGTMKANVNDYIIKGVNGEFYPCKPDIFAKTYEEVTE